MPRGQLKKDEIKCEVLKLKHQLEQDPRWSSDPKKLAHEYLNRVLDKINEYYW